MSAGHYPTNATTDEVIAAGHVEPLPPRVPSPEPGDHDTIQVLSNSAYWIGLSIATQPRRAQLSPSAARDAILAFRDRVPDYPHMRVVVRQVKLVDRTIFAAVTRLLHWLKTHYGAVWPLTGEQEHIIANIAIVDIGVWHKCAYIHTMRACTEGMRYNHRLLQLTMIEQMATSDYDHLRGIGMENDEDRVRGVHSAISTITREKYPESFRVMCPPPPKSARMDYGPAIAAAAATPLPESTTTITITTTTTTNDDRA